MKFCLTLFAIFLLLPWNSFAQTKDNYQQYAIKDSLKNVAYANGCKFKLKNVNNNYSRRFYRVDSVSEAFACDLTSKGIDTVMLCSYVHYNGPSPMDRQFVLWLDKGRGYIKGFFTNTKYELIEDNKGDFAVSPLLDYFFRKRLDTIKNEPKELFHISNPMGIEIQVYTPNLFFRKEYTEYMISDNKKHPFSKWWKMIWKKLFLSEQSISHFP